MSKLDPKHKNLRLALALGSVAALFFIGFLTRAYFFGI